MAGIEIWGRLLLALWDHFCRIWLSRYSPRPELLSLHLVLGLSGLAIINLPANFYAFVIDLPTGFPLLAKGLIWSLCHLHVPLQFVGYLQLFLLDAGSTAVTFSL